MDTWTLQSTLTGKYITELFTTKHDEQFGGKTKQDAYGWNSLKTIHILRKEIGCCIVVSCN